MQDDNNNNGYYPFRYTREYVLQPTWRWLFGGSQAAPKSIPGPTPRYLSGNLADISPDFWTAAEKLSKQYGGLVKLQVLGHLLFIVSEAKYAGHVLQQLPTKKVPKQELAADGVFLADGDTWRCARNLLQGCFIDRYMTGYVPIFSSKAVKYFSQMSDATTVPIIQVSEEIFFQTICEVGFGIPSDARFDNLRNEFNECFDYLLEEQLKRQTRPSFWNSFLVISNAKFHKELQRLNVILDRIIDASPSANRTDLLALMMNARHGNEQFSREQLRDQITTIMVAGHKTSALLLSWSLFCISQHPQVEEKLHKELMQVLNGRDPSQITLTDIKSLKYMQQVIQEVLRLYPPAQSALRGNAEEFTLGEYTIPKDSNFFVSIYLVHRDPNVWENPEKFDPERFEESKFNSLMKVHPYAYMPFGGGQRTCLGNLFAQSEVKVFLSHILYYFYPRLDPKHVIVQSADPLVPSTGINLIFHKRSGRNYAPASIAAPLHSLSIIRDGMVVDDVQTVERPNLIVLYGSNYGKCKELASKVVNSAKKMQMGCQFMSIDEYATRYLWNRRILDEDYWPATKKQAIILIMSTYNGEPAENCSEFYQYIMKTAATSEANSIVETMIKRIKYCIFGVGNKQWHMSYLKVPKNFKSKFDELGATEFYPFESGDESSDLDSKFEVWISNLWFFLAEQFNMIMPDFDSSMISSDLAEENVCMETLAGNAKIGKLNTDLLECRVTNSRILYQDRGNQAVELTISSIPNFRQLEYETGDHLEVLPMNDESIVKRFLNRFSLYNQLHQPIRLHYPEDKQPLWYTMVPAVTSLHQVLSYCVDLCGIVKRETISALSKMATNETEKQKLINLCSDKEESWNSYQQEVVARGINIVDLLEQYSSISSATVAHILSLLSPLRHRFYSISSSSLVSKNVNIVVGLNSYTVGQNTIRNGVCSKYLNRDNLTNEIIYCRAKKSEFKLPTDHTKPIICVCNGTGIAPFKAFIDERVALKNQNIDVGSVYLFFGCRNDLDNLFCGEWTDVVYNWTAFSRKSAVPKKYVQDLLLEQSALVCNTLFRDNGYFYVCGNAKTMAKGVHEVLQNMFTDAEVEDLKNSKHYRLDIW